MFNYMYRNVSGLRKTAKGCLLGLVLAAVPAIGAAEILWVGDFSTGDFSQWPGPSDQNSVEFWQMTAAYGRPIQYGGQPSGHVGNGELLSLVAATARTVNGVSYPQGPTRGNSEYSAKFTVKNSANGSEQVDCDASNCDRRRSMLTVQQALNNFWPNALPRFGDRWFSFSVYLPSNWSDSGSGSGVNVFEFKSYSVSAYGMFTVDIHNGNWKITNRWYPGDTTPVAGTSPWQYDMFYDGDEGGSCYPRSNFWPDGLAHFPDEAASCAALQSVNKGGWTDWIGHVKFDNRGAGEGGEGFLRLWKREKNGPWVQVLDIFPGTVERGGITFDHGIGFAHNNGYGPKVGMYGSKNQFWNLPENRFLFLANIKIADERSSFSDLSPDGTSPGGGGPNSPVPMPPTLE